MGVHIPTVGDGRFVSMNPVMDPEEPASKADLNKVETALRGDIKNLERLIIDYMESMDREIKDVRASLARLETRFDTQAIRLDRQARATRFPSWGPGSRNY